jgi:hypothetical protein
MRGGISSGSNEEPDPVIGKSQQAMPESPRVGCPRSFPRSLAVLPDLSYWLGSIFGSGRSAWPLTACDAQATDIARFPSIQQQMRDAACNRRMVSGEAGAWHLLFEWMRF